MRGSLRSALSLLLGCGILSGPWTACSRTPSPDKAGSATPTGSSSGSSAMPSVSPPTGPAKLLRVTDARHKVGFLDARFKLIVSPRFDFVDAPSEGLTLVSEDGNR